VAAKIVAVRRLRVEVAVVLGAGNLWRGTSAQAAAMDRASADHIGMLATMMNALALQDALERHGETVRVHTAIEMKQMAEPYIRRRAMHQLAKGYVVVLGAGTGNPFFTTDTAAALRAMELGCEVLIKATKVDGVYSADPLRVPGARRFNHLSFDQALALKLRVMDSTAFTLCMENRMPILVLDLWEPESLPRAVLGEPVGTLVDDRDGDLAAAVDTAGGLVALAAEGVDHD
jgi:uridylate kinase